MRVSYDPGRRWWTTRSFAVLLVLLATVPLLLPATPPITDLAGHLGRYQIELEVARSPYLHQWYSFHWSVVGNLGVDLLVVPLSALFGLEPAVKLIVLTIPPLTAAGMMFVAREVHGEMPASAAFAVPLAYAAPFQFGFVNYMLGVSVAILMFGLWLRLGRLRLVRARSLLFLLLAPALWVIHAFAWGILGVLALVASAAEARREGLDWGQTARQAIVRCLPLAPPLLLFVDWQGAHAAAGITAGFFQPWTKLAEMLSILRNTSVPFDISCAALLWALVLLGLRQLRFQFDAMLMTAAATLFAVFLLMPEALLGSSFAAMRLAPVCVAVAILSLRPVGGPRWQTAVAVAACLFLSMRLAVQTIHYAHLDGEWRRQLEALDHVPRGSRIFAMANVPCLGDWGGRRMEHLGAFGIVRRDAFVNGQWTLAGAQLLGIHYPQAEGFTGDPTQILMPAQCRQAASYGLSDALRLLPRAAFDYVWLIDLPPGEWPRDPGLRPVWHGARGVLYRIRGEGRPTVTSAE